MLSVSFLTALALLLQLTCASPTSINNKTPTPTTPFTLAAFYSPYPPGSNASGSYGVSGIRVRAFGGSFWVNPPNQKLATGCGELKGKKCPPGNETVLFVDSWGQAWLDSADPQQVYLDTQTGVLSYKTSVSNPPNSLSAAASVLNFLHLGQGTAVAVPIAGEPGYYNAGPGSFNWQGSENNYWFLCPRPGPGYQVMKYVGGNENWNSCLSGIQLVALDWTGSGPAAGEYL